MLKYWKVTYWQPESEELEGYTWLELLIHFEVTTGARVPQGVSAPKPGPLTPVTTRRAMLTFAHATRAIWRLLASPEDVVLLLPSTARPHRWRKRMVATLLPTVAGGPVWTPQREAQVLKGITDLRRTRGPDLFSTEGGDTTAAWLDLPRPPPWRDPLEGHTAATRPPPRTTPPRGGDAPPPDERGSSLRVPEKLWVRSRLPIPDPAQLHRPPGTGVPVP